MRLSHRVQIGTRILLLAGGLAGLASGCGDDKPTIAPADQTTVKANQSNSAAWEQEKSQQKSAKK